MASTVQVAEGTKRTLERIRPRGLTYDQVLGQILATRPLEDWREFLEAGLSRDAAMVLSRLAYNRGALTTRRDPSEQVLLAESAAEQWRRWEATGRIRPTGRRSYSYRVSSGGTRRASVRRVR